MPLRRVNQKPKNPAERIDTWAGPKLEEFFGGAPAPKPAVEEKPAIVEKVQKAPPKPSQIIPQPNNYRQVFDDLYAKGYGVNGAEYAQQDTPEKAAAWAWQTWGDGDLIAVQMPNNKWVGFHSGLMPLKPVEAPKVSPFDGLAEEMKKRGWSPSPSLAEHGFRRKAESAWISQLVGPVNNGKWEAYYSSGGTSGRVIRSPPVDTPDQAVDELLRMLSDKAYLEQLEAAQSEGIEEITESKGEPERAHGQAAIVEEENAEPEERGDSVDRYRTGMGYYEDAFNKATHGEFYGTAAGVGFSVTGVKEFAALLQKYPGSAPALAAGFANMKAFDEEYGKDDPKETQLVYQVEQLLAKYGVALPPITPHLTEWPFGEVVAEAEKLGWFVEKGLSDNDHLFLRERASAQRAVSMAREATGLWIVHGETGMFTSASVKKAGDWLIGDLKSLMEFKAGDYVGFAGSWYNHNVYRLTSPAGPGKWNVENIEHMPKHTPVSVLEEKDMVKFPDYETPEQEEAKHLERTRVWQKEYGLKPEELRKLLQEYRAKHVPEEYLKKVEASYGHEDHVEDIIRLGWIIRGGKRVEVKGLADWPDFEMENGERLNVNFIEGRNRESEVYSLGFGMKGPMREEKEVKAEIVDHDDPERGLKAHYTAILPASGTLLRVTPPGQPTVDQLVHAGDDIQEDDEFPAGSIHASHLVVAVHKHQEYGLPVYSIVEAKVGDRPKGAGGKWRETQLGYINNLVAQDGRILGFMQDSNEEIKVVGHEDLSMPGTLAEAEVEEEPEEPEEEENEEEPGEE